MSLLENLVSQAAQNALGTLSKDKTGLASMIGALNSQLTDNSSLSNILGNVLGGQQDSKQGMLMAILVPMVLKWIQSNGGLSGVLSKVQSLGLDKQVQSWISTETENINLNESQITHLFGEEKINEVADQVGTESSSVIQGLSSLLPEIINQLTPDGKEKEEPANQEIGDILGKLGGLL